MASFLLTRSALFVPEPNIHRSRRPLQDFSVESGGGRDTSNNRQDESEGSDVVFSLVQNDQACFSCGRAISRLTVWCQQGLYGASIAVRQPHNAVVSAVSLKRKDLSINDLLTCVILSTPGWRLQKVWFAKDSPLFEKTLCNVSGSRSQLNPTEFVIRARGARFAGCLGMLRP